MTAILTLRRLTAKAGMVAATLVSAAPAALAEGSAGSDAFALAREVCADPGQPALCALLRDQIADHVAQSLLVVGASGQRAAAIETVRDFVHWSQPIVRYAAATAIGGLHPAAEDTPALARLLNDAVPAVRTAALGSLGVSSDPLARRLAERAWERGGQGSAMVPDGPLIDPAALPVALPEGAEPVRFTNDRADGVAAWVTDAPPETVLAELAAKLGLEPITLDALAALYRSDADRPQVDVNDPMAMMQYMMELQQRMEQLPEAEREQAYMAAIMALVAEDDAARASPVARWRDADRYGAPMAVVLPDDPRLPMPFPTRIAFVYHDVTLGRTGFALQWVDPATIPPAPEPLAQEPAVTSAIFGLQSRRDEGMSLAVGSLEEQVWEAVLWSGDPVAAGYFLELFPDSSHAAEATRLRDGEALSDGATAESSSLFNRTAAPELAVDVAAFVDNEPIVLRYRGLDRMADRSPWITISPAGSDDATFGTWFYTEGAEGVATLPHQRAGDYELRLYVEYPREVVVRLPVTVGPAPASDVPVVTVEQPVLAVRETIGVRWAGLPEDRTGWITVVPVGTPETQWGSWAYTDGGDTGRLTLTGPDTPGDYEIRVYLEGPREVVARAPVSMVTE